MRPDDGAAEIDPQDSAGERPRFALVAEIIWIDGAAVGCADRGGLGLVGCDAIALIIYDAKIELGGCETLRGCDFVPMPRLVEILRHAHPSGVGPGKAGAVSRQLRADNPVRGVKRYADRKGETFLSSTELGRIGAALAAAEANGANPSAVAIIRLLAFTGARKSEIFGLKWSEVDVERGYLRLGDSKTGAKVIPIGAPAREVLAGHAAAADSVYVFPAASDASHFQGVDKVWRNVRAAAGFPNLRIHDLRHSFASVGLARGDALPVIGAILGHADVKTTSRYAHLADDPVKIAADAISRSVHAAFSNSAIAGVISIANGKRGT